jgi:hypothetical protein
LRKPMMACPPRNTAANRSTPFCSGIEPSIRPSIVGDGIGQFSEMLLGLGGIAHGRESIKVMAVGCEADFGVAVEVGYPLGHGEPGGDSQMHETELWIDKIELQAQALTPGRDETGPFLCGDKLEALACFHRSQDADKPFGDAIAISDGLGFFLFSDLPVEVDVGPADLFGHSPGMVFKGFRVCHHEALEISEQDTLVRHETVHGLRTTDRQISLKKYPIKTGYRSGGFCVCL